LIHWNDQLKKPKSAESKPNGFRGKLPDLPAAKLEPKKARPLSPIRVGYLFAAELFLLNQKSLSSTAIEVSHTEPKIVLHSEAGDKIEILFVDLVADNNEEISLVLKLGKDNRRVSSQNDIGKVIKVLEKFLSAKKKRVAVDGFSKGFLHGHLISFFSIPSSHAFSDAGALGNVKTAISGVFTKAQEAWQNPELFVIKELGENLIKPILPTGSVCESIVDHAMNCTKWDIQKGFVEKAVVDVKQKATKAFDDLCKLLPRTATIVAKKVLEKLSARNPKKGKAQDAKKESEAREVLDQLKESGPKNVCSTFNHLERASTVVKYLIAATVHACEEAHPNPVTGYKSMYAWLHQGFHGRNRIDLRFENFDIAKCFTQRKGVTEIISDAIQ